MPEIRKRFSKSVSRSKKRARTVIGTTGIRTRRFPRRCACRARREGAARSVHPGFVSAGMRTLALPVMFLLAAAFLSSAPAVQTIPYRDARPVLESLRRDLLPDDLRSKTPAEIEAAWPDWVAEHDRVTRARIGRGDRDSIVNFLLFGTTFTSEPRATAAALLALNERPHEALSLFARRIDDLVAALAAPGSNERLQFARRFVERQGMQPETAAGRLELRRYLTDSVRQAPAEVV